LLVSFSVQIIYRIVSYRKAYSNEGTFVEDTQVKMHA